MKASFAADGAVFACDGINLARETLRSHPSRLGRRSVRSHGMLSGHTLVVVITTELVFFQVA